MMILPRQARDKHRKTHSKKARFVEGLIMMRNGVNITINSDDPGTANCIIIDHLSAFEPGLVALFLYVA
jgi:hypothetical protein|eukprot:COSAG06_NODE_1749_length_8472_cov_6.578866_7_plen_69_part_00